jgi:acetyl esterase/lipase
MTDTASLDFWLNVEAWDLLDINDDGEALVSATVPGTAQLFMVTPTDRRQLTALSGPCTGRLLTDRPLAVVQHDRQGDGRFNLSLLDLSDRQRPPAADTGLLALTRNDQTSEFLMDTGPGWVAYTTNQRNGTDFDVVLHELVSGTEKTLFTMGGHVSEVAVRTDPADPLRNPTTAVTTFTTQGLSTHLYLISAGVTHELSSPDQRGVHSRISITADLRGVLASSDAAFERLELRHFDLDSEPRTIVRDDDSDVFATASPDGKHLAVVHARRGVSRLVIRDMHGEQVQELQLPAAGVVEVRWSPSSEWLAVHLNTVYSPSEIYRLHRSDWQPELVVSSDHDHGIRANRRVSYPDFVEVPTRDGYAIPCHVYRPAEAPASSLTPAVVYLHGGPEDHEAETFSPLQQYLTDAGFLVIAPDVRGSTGYGKTWYCLDDRRLRMDAVADLADLHARLPQLGADPQRTALAGASYGGYLTLCGLVFQPDLWAAGADVMGISCLISYLENTAPYLRKVRESEYGYLDRDRDFLRAASPLHHADKIQAPLLIIHGANDPRVPLTESEQFAAAARRAGAECTLTVFSDEGHGLTRKPNRRNAYAQIAEFLHRHLDQPETFQ